MWALEGFPKLIRLENFRHKELLHENYGRPKDLLKIKKRPWQVLLNCPASLSLRRDWWAQKDLNPRPADYEKVKLL
jgi:hypothetical protein